MAQLRLVRMASSLSQRGYSRSADVILAFAQWRTNTGAIRLARRKLPIVRLSRSEIQEICDLVIQQRPGVSLTRVTPVTAGYSPATASIARLNFQCGNEAFSVVAKVYKLPDKEIPGWSPRELEVNRFAQAFSGEVLRLPSMYGCVRTSFGQPVLLSEWVVESPHSEIGALRSIALGELAGIDPREHPDFVSFLGVNPSYQRGGSMKSGFGVISRHLGASRSAEISRQFDEQVARVPHLLDLYKELPLRFAHGDAQGANLVPDADNRVALLDIGNMRLEPIGYDFATLMGSRFRNGRSSIDRDAKIEARSMRNFIRGVEQSGDSLSDRDLRVSYAVGLSRLFRNAIKRSARFGDDTTKVQRESWIIDRYIAALKRTVDVLS